MKKDNEYNKMVGERVKAIRTAKGITQMELLEVIGSKSTSSDERTANYISMIERGKRGLTAKNIQKICETYDVSPDYLMLRSDYMTDRERGIAELRAINSENKIEAQFFELMAAKLGYDVKKTDILSVADVEAVKDIETCRLTNESGDSISFTIDDINDIVSDVEEYAIMRLRRLVGKKREAVTNGEH